MKEIKFWISLISSIILVCFIVGIVEMKNVNHVYDSLKYETIEEIKGVYEVKNTYNISTKQERDKIYYLLQIKGVFYTADIENLSFKSNKIDIKDIPNHNNKILTVNNVSIVNLIFKFNTQPTEVIFNNKSIEDTNVSVKDFNKVKNNIDKYEDEFINIKQTEHKKYVHSFIKIVGIMLIAIFLLSLSIISTLITACDCDMES